MRVGSPPITFVYHLGVHCTDEDMLVQSLMRNSGILVERKVIVPRPRRYRTKLTEISAEYRGTAPPDDAQERFLMEILRGYEAERLIFSYESFLSHPAKVFEYHQFYGKARFRGTWLRNLFPDNPCEFFLAIRNPATFIPAAMQRADVSDYVRYMNGFDPRAIRWIDVVGALQENNPDCPVIVWCNEDIPLIWPTILREITDLEAVDAMEGEYDIVERIMKPEGFQRMLGYLDSHKPQNEIQRRRVVSAFLDKFAIDDAVIEEVDLPGWTPQLVDEITRIYEEDVRQIAQMPAVTLIAN